MRALLEKLHQLYPKLPPAASHQDLLRIRKDPWQTPAGRIARPLPGIESWVNGARTEGHGSHVDGALEAQREIDWRPARVMVHVIMNEPDYAGPVRHRLHAPKALRQVRELLRRQLNVN